MNTKQIKSKLEELAPWHFDIKITPELSTKDGNAKCFSNINRQWI